MLTAGQLQLLQDWLRGHFLAGTVEPLIERGIEFSGRRLITETIPDAQAWVRSMSLHEFLTARSIPLCESIDAACERGWVTPFRSRTTINKTLWYVINEEVTLPLELTREDATAVAEPVAPTTRAASAETETKSRRRERGPGQESDD